MKITAVEFLELRVPLQKPFARSKKIGTLTDCTPILIQLHTDSGLVGLGETNPVQPITAEDAETTLLVLKKNLAPALLGADPRNLADIHARMDSALSYWSLPKAGMDLACYDLLGKYAKLRIADLMGGVVHEKLPILWAVGMDTPEGNVEDAVFYQKQGFTCLMIKAGAGTIEQDVVRVREIRRAVGPDYPLIVDANMAWDVMNAVRFAKLIEDCNIDLLEQPVGKEDYDGLAEVRRRVGVPISADESIHSLAQAKILIEKKAVDVFSIKVIKHGGLRNTREIMKYAEANGICCLMNSNAEQGVTQAASMQMAACATNLWPHGHAYRSPLRLEADISTYSDYVKDGWVSVPDAPGCGVSLKPEAVERFLVARHRIE